MFIKKRRSRELREHSIRNFVQIELNPKTRAELLSLIHMLRKSEPTTTTTTTTTTATENDLIINYILDSNDDFFNMYRLKNNMERSAIETERRAAIAKAAKKAAWIDAEAHAYIRHQIHGILDGSIAPHSQNPTLAKLADEVRSRAEEIVGNVGSDGIFDVLHVDSKN